MIKTIYIGGTLKEAARRVADAWHRAERGEAVKPQDNVTVARDELRKPAGALGVTYLSDDFDAPLSADILAEFDVLGSDLRRR